MKTFYPFDTDDALVLGRGWLGGWALPQERSYFSLRLPQGWWLLALDTALNSHLPPPNTTLPTRRSTHG